ncbi:hypothetical protein FFK22_018240 [Mycobacterium sp. KBS0706]|uniref:hypothetical protein n=1 Tax=Mycobacterium sp. KBS0706 TaxID=2578109 RepID=UPI00110F9EFF|nr:hypothetical protein [Mycobacterium sp. KBS0706]TSD87274.1 hypothetical protein FFK22_018240 [Mycobacterium sp. KBS0706]
MRTLLLAAGIALAGTTAQAGPAAPVCAPYDAFAAALRDQVKEVPVARMLSTRGHVVEILASPGGETYTILVVTPDGLACVVDFGEAYSPVPEKPAV